MEFLETRKKEILGRDWIFDFPKRAFPLHSFYFGMDVFKRGGYMRSQAIGESTMPLSMTW